MPFRSVKQWRKLWAIRPDIARRWTRRYGSKPRPRRKTKAGHWKM